MVTEQEPECLISSHLCFLGPKNGQQLESEPSRVARCWEGRSEACRLACSFVAAFLSPPHHRAQDKAVGEGRGCSSDRCCFQFLCNSAPFYFRQLSLGSANCRNLGPSGWWVPQAGRSLRGGRGGRGGGPGSCEQGCEAQGLEVLFPAPSLCVARFPPLLPAFPELIHRCYYSGGKKNCSALANSKVSSLCPDYCVAS